MENERVVNQTMKTHNQLLGNLLSQSIIAIISQSSLISLVHLFQKEKLVYRRKILWMNFLLSQCISTMMWRERRWSHRHQVGAVQTRRMVLNSTTLVTMPQFAIKSKWSRVLYKDSVEIIAEVLLGHFQ